MLGVGKRVAGTALAGAFGLGVMNTTAPAVKDAAMQSAFGDPNADKYFTGRDLDTRFMMGGAIGGTLGGAMQLSAPGDFGFANPGIAAGAGASIGALGGAAGLGSIGAIIGSRRGRVGKGMGGAIGGLVGLGLGAATGYSASMQNNRNFYRNSPYARNASSQTAMNLSAVGDIVLGMHNNRGGM